MQSVNISYFTKEIEMKDAAVIISKAGFENLDYTPPIEREDWEIVMNHDMGIFAKESLHVHQTHAPFDRYDTHGEEHIKRIYRVLDATERMGAEFMVVHGDEFDFKNEEYSPERALEYNYELFAPIVEKAAGMNVNIAFENVFKDGPDWKGRYCSKSEELLTIIEKFNSDNVCCCWDFGHAGVAFGDEHPEKIRELGKYIKCTHVHDCGHEQDLHLPPFLGDNNWRACMQAMKDINYTGILSFELVYGKIPEIFATQFAGSLFETGKILESFMNNR